VSLVRFAVWKKDMITRNFLGQFHFSVESLMDEVPRDRWYVLLLASARPFLLLLLPYGGCCSSRPTSDEVASERERMSVRARS